MVIKMSWENILKDDPERDDFDEHVGFDSKEQLSNYVYDELRKQFMHLSKHFNMTSESNGYIRDLDDLPDFLKGLISDLKTHIKDIETF